MHWSLTLFELFSRMHLGLLELNRTSEIKLVKHHQGLQLVSKILHVFRYGVVSWRCENAELNQVAGCQTLQVVHVGTRGSDFKYFAHSDFDSTFSEYEATADVFVLQPYNIDIKIQQYLIWTDVNIIRWKISENILLKASFPEMVSYFCMRDQA